MDFLLRIFFSGLVAFVPGDDGKDVTVLLLNTHAHQTADGAMVAHHEPMLLGRAERCDGDCRPDDPRLADALFSDRPAPQALDALSLAVDGGGAWSLDGVELSFRSTGGGALQPPLVLHDNAPAGASAVPMTAAERESFRWVADVKRVFPAFGTFNPKLFGAQPPRDVVASRLKLDRGRFFTYALVRVNGKVRPLHFRALAGKRDVPHAQAAAGWVAAEIRVPGDSIEVVAKRFDDGSERTMRLTPRDGVLEMAILNLPPFEVPRAGKRRPTPQPGRHFELFYSLASNPPAENQRPVPHARASDVHADWDAVHPREALWSPLLAKLRLEPGKGPYDVVLCPVTQGSQP